MMTQRQFDCSVEQRVAKRLDDYYTSKGIKFERVYDKQLQWKGVDLILFNRSKSINIDEKAKYKGLQEDGAQLNNYSFEVDRICRDGKRRLGWFLDKKNVTDYYCYAFPKFEQPEDINSAIKPNMQVDMFKKKDIIALIEKETTLGMIEQQAYMMDFSGTARIQFADFALYKTPAHVLPEQPINIIIARETIEQTPHFKRFYV